MHFIATHTYFKIRYRRLPIFYTGARVLKYVSSECDKVPRFDRILWKNGHIGFSNKCSLFDTILRSNKTRKNCNCSIASSQAQTFIMASCLMLQAKESIIER